MNNGRNEETAGEGFKRPGRHSSRWSRAEEGELTIRKRPFHTRKRR